MGTAIKGPLSSVAEGVMRSKGLGDADQMVWQVARSLLGSISATPESWSPKPEAEEVDAVEPAPVIEDTFWHHSIHAMQHTWRFMGN